MSFCTFANRMKKGFKIVLSCLLAASVLFASTGVVIASHVCLKKNKSDISFFESKSCCSKHDKSCRTETVIKTKCCQFSLSYHKLEVNTAVKSASSIESISISVLDAGISSAEFSSFEKSFSHSEHPPAILRLQPGSKNFLHSIQLLLI